MAIFPEVDRSKCNGCGLCVNVCEPGGLVLGEDLLVTIVETAVCDWCADCEAVCPTGSIRCAYEIVFETSE
jgi:NAD-dependent dihydropyrimidine dehydrogenase PreA subunit